MYRNVVRYVMHCRSAIGEIHPTTTTWTLIFHLSSSIALFHRIGLIFSGDFQSLLMEILDRSLHRLLNKICCQEALPSLMRRRSEVLVGRIILRHGATRIIITNRGTVIQSTFVSALVDLCNVDHRMTTAYHPQRMD
ncbi:transposon Ty3-I Gag-Pol polyprotein [Trichonephila clavata]|uniref:Transposon Ty3-I Gag-Pol polyprotein n=1 Tax=Trichonephila clavata TaxID=2740835 RepID=A0A8X6K6R0_TRICU|nr:transposon Ty3-I Gag-Pol polyprotein [Trichonephila clavata]